MDLSDFPRLPAELPSQPATPPSTDAQRWCDILGTLSVETAAALTDAIERVQALATTGRIDRAGLRALAGDLQHARQAGLIGQQLTRLASGRLRQAPERLPLADTLLDVLHQRAAETQARGIAVRHALQPADVLVDGALLFTLLDTLLAWALGHARTGIAFRTDVKAWPAHARLQARFAHGGADADAATVAALDSMAWRLLEQTAWAMGVPLERRLQGAHVEVTVEFPRTVDAHVEGVTAVALDEGFSPSLSATPLAGSHVLVVASRRDVRREVRDALRPMNLVVDYVASVDEARAFCRTGVPHAVVVEAALRGNRLDDLRRECDGSGAKVAFVEITEEGHGFEVSGFGGLTPARVGRDAIASTLPSALLFELSRAT